MKGFCRVSWLLPIGQLASGVLLGMTAGGLFSPWATSASQVRVPIDSARSSLNLQLCANPGGLGTDCDEETRPVGGFMTVALDHNGNPSQIQLRNFDVQAVGDYTLGLSWVFGAARVDGTISGLRIYHARPGPTNAAAGVSGGGFVLSGVPFRSAGTANYRINDLVCGLIAFPCTSNINLSTLGENSITALPGTIQLTDGILAIDVDFTFESPLDPATPELGTLRGRVILHGSAPVSQSLVPKGADWRYLDTGVDLGLGWASPQIDDSLWPFGPAPLGYGDGDEESVVSFGPDPANKYVTTYFRHTFQVPDVFEINSLALRVQHDDGVVVYLNDMEIYRNNMPAGLPGFQTLASASVGGAAESVYFQAPTIAVTPLMNGPNVVAVEIHQSAVDSSDISFDLELLANTILTNQPPAVVITSPTNNAAFPEGGIVVSADASDADSLVTRVAFYEGANLLGEDTTAPYSVAWSSICAGTYVLMARAFDSAGGESASAPVIVQVTRPPVSLIAIGSVWRFQDNGVDLGAAWRQPGFNDAAWASGAAQLGFGDGDELTMVSGGPGTNRHTVYFRHAFPVTRVEGIAGLNLRLLRDDGAAVYLNGVEVYRNNLPAGAVTFATLAVSNALPAEETSHFLTATISPAALSNGVNVVAVEVHQNALNSSDLSFDLGLTANVTNLPPSSALLVSPVDGAEAPAGAPISFRAEATDVDGGVVRVEYYAGAHRLGQATVAPYSFTWLNAPVGYHWITARAVDGCEASRVSAPVAVRVGAFTMVPPGATWRFLDDGSDPGTAWREPVFDDGAWRAGAAELGYGDGDEATLINGGPATAHFMTAYFRRDWNVADPTVVTGLVVRLLRDDGAVVYVNGVELFRSNLPEGPVLTTTPAVNAVAGADETRYVIHEPTAGMLVTGRNVLAVEVHQLAPNSSDMSFDLELIGLVRPHAPSLRIERLGDSHRVSWPISAAGFRLQSTASLSPADWQPVPNSPATDGASKSLLFPNTGDRRFYRLGP